MEYLIESNPAFLLLRISENEYVFYNSLQHIGARLTKVEVQILDMIYTYQDKDYILLKFPDIHKETIKRSMETVENLNLLCLDEIAEQNKTELVYPSEFYIHLTYRCNLRCSYCYNKTIRESFRQGLSLDEWQRIIDKIVPFAKRIVLTGGELFLFEGIACILEYIKNKNSAIQLSAISNGMHNFEKLSKKGVFDHLSEISMSCDSLNNEGERKGFNPKLFRDNVLWLRQNHPEIRLTIASVCTYNNSEEITKTVNFCKDLGIVFDKTILLPSSSAEIDLMPSISDLINDREPKNDEIEKLKKARFRCSAGKGICSIDPCGNVFPCQSLHYEELKLGNLMDSSLESIFNGRFKMKGVNEIPVCSRCNVKYICGGGCLASGYSLYGQRLDRNHLTCRLNRESSIAILKSLNNRMRV